jgi:hypothetical protein
MKEFKKELILKVGIILSIVIGGLFFILTQNKTDEGSVEDLKKLSYCNNLLVQTLPTQGKVYYSYKSPSFPPGCFTLEIYGMIKNKELSKFLSTKIFKHEIWSFCVFPGHMANYLSTVDLTFSKANGNITYEGKVHYIYCKHNNINYKLFIIDKNGLFHLEIIKGRE